jgi:hypothetical protein
MTRWGRPVNGGGLLRGLLRNPGGEIGDQFDGKSLQQAWRQKTSAAA